MPYRHAHFALLLLFPLTGLAFWQGYFSDLSAAPFALHAHGLTASLWIGLLAFQNWSIHGRRNALHRSAGLGIFLLLPLFTAAGLLVIQSMAQKFATNADPFTSAFGARLAIIDALATLGVLFLVFQALAERRRVHQHSTAMLATVVLLISPIVARLLPQAPGFPREGLAGAHPFEVAFHGAQLIALAVAVGLYWRDRRRRGPFLLAAALVAIQSLLFETLGRTTAWEDAFTALATAPAPAVVGLGIAAGAISLWAGWSRGGAPRPVAAAPAGAA